MSRLTVTCPKCGRLHRGPRSVEQLHVEARHVLIRSFGMAIADAREYLRSQWLGGALELSGWCADCAVQEIAATCPSTDKAELEKAAMVVTTSMPAEDLVEGAFVAGKPLHICTVLPLFGAKQKERVARDLLDLGSPKPGGAP